jgi:hypothetical protein
MRDIHDEDRHREDGGHPDESRIHGLIHDDSCTNQSYAKPLTASLNFLRRYPNVINSF